MPFLRRVCVSISNFVVFRNETESRFELNLLLCCQVYEDSTVKKENLQVRAQTSKLRFHIICLIIVVEHEMAIHLEDLLSWSLFFLDVIIRRRFDANVIITNIIVKWERASPQFPAIHLCCVDDVSRRNAMWIRDNWKTHSRPRRVHIFFCYSSKNVLFDIFFLWLLCKTKIFFGHTRGSQRHWLGWFVDVVMWRFGWGRSSLRRNWKFYARQFVDVCDVVMEKVQTFSQSCESSLKSSPRFFLYFICRTGQIIKNM